MGKSAKARKQRVSRSSSIRLPIGAVQTVPHDPPVSRQLPSQRRRKLLHSCERLFEASAAASAGETDRDLAVPQFTQNCGAYNIIEF
jgi:hypothetical protein